MNATEVKPWKAAMPEFREKTDAFYAGELNKGAYKGFSGYYGSYAQKDGKASMLRLRMPAGRVTGERLAFVARMIREYGVKRVHFTTCQTIQLHDLKRSSCIRLWSRRWMRGSPSWEAAGISRET